MDKKLVSTLQQTLGTSANQVFYNSSQYCAQYNPDLTVRH